ncbi:MAG: glutamine amidotransferase [Bacilli bacterium]
MKKIKIAHLYYDLMNLYGENGNVRVLAKTLEKQNLDVEVRFLSIEDEIDFQSYDFFYIGTGSEENQLLVLEHLKNYQNDIKDAIENGKYFIVTGNAIELFGKQIITKDNQVIDTLNIFDYESIITDFRIIGEQVYTTSLLDKKIIGFQNRETIMKTNNNNSLFNVITGTGYEPNIKKEGIHYKNFFGTYLLGPILVRNPYFLDLIINNYLHTLDLDYKKDENDVIYKAYHEYINNFVNE